MIARRKRGFFSSSFVVALSLLPGASFAAITGYLDYRSIDVNLDYSQQNYKFQPLYDFGSAIIAQSDPAAQNPVFPAPGFTIPSSPVSNYLSLKEITYQGAVSGYQIFAKLIDAAAFKTLQTECFASNNCSFVDGDPNILHYDLIYKGLGGTYDLPILVNNGLRAGTVDEFIAARRNLGLPNLPPASLNYLQISANPSDFTSGAIVPIVSLNDYFANPAGLGVIYNFDATQFCDQYTGADGAACNNKPVALIHGLLDVEYLTPVTPPAQLSAGNPSNVTQAAANMPHSLNASLSAPTNVSAFIYCSGDTGQMAGLPCQLTINNFDLPNFQGGEGASIVVPGSSVNISLSNLAATGNSTVQRFSVAPGPHTVQLVSTANGQSGTAYTIASFTAPAPSTGMYEEVQLANSTVAGCKGATFYIGNVPTNVPAYPSGFPAATPPYLYGQNLCTGVYQINLSATADSLSGTKPEVAYQTFYVFVFASPNPALASWLKGGEGAGSAPNVTLLSTPITPNGISGVYVYSGANPTDPATVSVNGTTAPIFQADMQEYADDISAINSKYFNPVSNAKPINFVFSEAMDLQFPGYGITMNWGTPPGQPIAGVAAGVPFSSNAAAAQPGADPRDLIGYPGADTNAYEPPLPGKTGLPISAWLPQTMQIFHNINVHYVLDYGMPSGFKGLFWIFNDKEENYLAQFMTYFSVSQNYPDGSGVTIDPESGLNEPMPVYLFKALADRLAYRGQFFGYYEFGDVFTPSVSDAMGPLGVELVSRYDTGQYRAPENSSDLSGSIGYLDQGWTQTQLNNTGSDGIYQEILNAITCGGIGIAAHPTANPPTAAVAGTASFCSLGTQDQVSENNRRWTTPDTIYPDAGLSPEDGMIEFNGQYSVVLPAGAAATSWDFNEIWYPNFATTSATAQGDAPNIIRAGSNACAAMNNQFFINNETTLDPTSPPSTAQTQLLNCIDGNSVGGVVLQNYARCGKDSSGVTIPYATCILISAVPGLTAPGTPVAGTDTQYIQSLSSASNTTYPTDQHLVGYSYFAIENLRTSKVPPAGVDPVKYANQQVQEPWYSAGVAITGKTPYYDSNMPYDPYYQANAATEIPEIWGAAATGTTLLFTKPNN